MTGDTRAASTAGSPPPGRNLKSMPIDPDALVLFTQELVRIPSVHDPATGRNEGSAAELSPPRCGRSAGTRSSTRSRRAGPT